MLLPVVGFAQQRPDNVIIWPYFFYPPYVVIGDDGELSGINREQYLTYSILILVSGPNVLVTRKGTLDQYKKDTRVLLAELLEEDSLGHINQFSYGKRMDRLLTSHLGESTFS